MSHRLRPAFALVASALAVLALAGSAFAASGGSPLKLSASRTSIRRNVTLSAATVRQLVDHGARVTAYFKVVSGVKGADARLYAYQRALNRGGATGSRPPAGYRTFISELVRLPGIKTGTRTVSLHVQPQFRQELLHAGSITLGIEAFGYGS